MKNGGDSKQPDVKEDIHPGDLGGADLGDTKDTMADAQDVIANDVIELVDTSDLQASLSRSGQT